MKKIIYLLLTFIAFSISYSQQHWENAINEKKVNQNYSIFVDHAPVYLQPSIKSKTVFTLKTGDFVLIKSKEKTLYQLNATKEYWYQITYKDKSGYIWGGFLADGAFTIQEKQILIKNLGVKQSKMEILLLENKKVLTKTIWNSGPVGSDKDFEIKFFSTKGLNNPPLLLFAIGYFVYSEIEFGAETFQMITLNSDKTLKTHFSWIPAACDPPMCGETKLLFPGNTISADVKTKRPSLKALENSILIIHHGYNIEDKNEHDYFTNEYRWNGMNFILNEKN